MPFACLLALPCPALPSPLRQVGFTNGLVVTSQGVAERSSRWAELLSPECWGVVPTPAQLAGLGFPRQELGSGPGLPQGLARGQSPGCWLHIGSLVPAGPIARLLCALFTGRAGHPPKGIISSGQARQLHQPHAGRQGT